MNNNNESESMTETSDYKVLMRDLTAALADGPKSTRELRSTFCPPWPEWQLNNCLGYLGAVKVPGNGAFAPSMVYAPGDPNAPVPEVDKWLTELFDRLGPAEVMAGVIIAENRAGPEYSKGTLKQAYTRLGMTSVKRGGQWWRCRPDKGVSEPVASSAAARHARALLDDNEAGRNAIKAALGESVGSKADLDDAIPPTPRMTTEQRWQWIVELVDAMALLGELVERGEQHGEQTYAIRAWGE